MDLVAGAPDGALLAGRRQLDDDAGDQVGVVLNLRRCASGMGGADARCDQEATALLRLCGVGGGGKRGLEAEGAYIGH